MQVLIFDMDDTLVIEETSVNEAFIETCQQVETIHGIKAVELHIAVRQEARKIWHQAPVRQYCLNVGISSWEGLNGRFDGDSTELRILREWIPGYQLKSWNNALMKFGINDTDLALSLSALYIKNRSERHLLFDDTKSCLDELSRFYNLALLTNGAADIQREKLESTGISKYFAEIIISGEVGYGKPDVRIFQLMASRLNAAPEQTWMIGNSLNSDISGAKASRMKTAWVNRTGKARDNTLIPDLEVRDLKQLTEVMRDLLSLNQ
jgi:putative hydrolase of the HAD superfamily